MKVMFIQPRAYLGQTTGPPLGFGYLAACLEDVGHKVKILDAPILNLRKRKIKKEIRQFDPDVVGVSSVTHNIGNALSLVEMAKENNPNCMTILGGPHATMTTKEILSENPYVDFIVRGEGEKTLVELLEKTKEKDFEKVKGISFKQNGRIIENENREPIADLDSIPFPAYHLFPMERYKTKVIDREIYGKPGQPMSSIITSRGCPNNCIFCSTCALWGKKWRTRSPENVVEELKILRYKYGKKVIDFLDDTLTVDKKRTMRICELIKEEGLDISWMCLSRVNLFTKEIASSLKKAGCFAVTFGFESGVQKTLDFLKKGFTVEDSKRAVQIAKETGLKVAGTFIIGVPGETRETINENISFVRNLNLNFTNFSILVPFPGTEIYEIAEKNNLLLTRDWSKYLSTNSVMKVPGFTPRELRKLHKKAKYMMLLPRI